MLLGILARNLFVLSVPKDAQENSISFKEVLAIVEDPSSDEIIIDVRTREELFQNGKIPGSFNVPIGEIKDAFSKLTADAFKDSYGFAKPSLSHPMVVYCGSGRRARKAFKILVEMGYSNIRVYDGSWLDWIANGGPIEPIPEPNPSLPGTNLDMEFMMSPHSK